MDHMLKVRQNATEMQDYLHDLSGFIDDIKKKDEELLTGKIAVKSKKLPPVRGSEGKKKKKKKTCKEGTDAEAEAVSTEDDLNNGSSTNGNGKKTRIRGFDFRAWDKYDVDAACDDIDEQENSKGDIEMSSSEDEDHEDSYEAQERRIAIANQRKEEGNALFKDGKFEAAAHVYGEGVVLDPTNELLLANRAMAYIKLGRFDKAEADCDLAIALNSHYTKAFMRRGAARLEQGNLTGSKADFEHVIVLEPTNKACRRDLQRVNDRITGKSPSEVDIDSTQKKRKVVAAGEKKEEVKVKKEDEPMVRMVVEEIGVADEKKNNIATPVSAVPVSKKPSEVPCNHMPSTPVPSSKNIPPVVSSSVSNVRLPEAPPKTSFEFFKNWSSIKASCDDGLLADYLYMIPPSSFPSVFKENLEAPMLLKMLSLVRKEFPLKGRVCMPILSALTTVKRFDITLMFLSSKETQFVKEIFENLFAHSMDTEGVTEADIKSLAGKYGINKL